MGQFIAKCAGIKDGKYADRYGKRGLRNRFGMPIISPPVEMIDPPKNTVSYALVMEDKDAFPVCGFSYIHWTACNITTDSIPEDASRQGLFTQGVNSWFVSAPSKECACYGGMAPPNAPHIYEIHVYALDKLLDLTDGFLYNELYRAMDGHILAESTIKGIYDN